MGTEVRQKKRISNEQREQTRTFNKNGILQTKTLHVQDHVSLNLTCTKRRRLRQMILLPWKTLNTRKIND